MGIQGLVMEWVAHWVALKHWEGHWVCWWVVHQGRILGLMSWVVALDQSWCWMVVSLGSPET